MAQPMAVSGHLLPAFVAVMGAGPQGFHGIRIASPGAPQVPADSLPRVDPWLVACAVAAGSQPSFCRVPTPRVRPARDAAYGGVAHGPAIVSTRKVEYGTNVRPPADGSTQRPR
jgi:hypothetical protein